MTVGVAPAFTGWLDEFFDAFWRGRPVNASFAGVHDYDDTLPDIDTLAVDASALLERLRALPTEHLSAAEALDRELAEGFLLIQRWESSSAHFGWRNPSFLTSEAVFGVLSLLLQPGTSFEEGQRVAKARLQAIPDFLGSATRRLHAAPSAWIDRARRECTGARLLLANLDDPHAAASMAAFERFDEFLHGELLPHAVDDYACGADAFDLLLRHGHFLDCSAEELERLALERMAEEQRVLAEMTPGRERDEGDEPYLARFARMWRDSVELAEQRDLLTFPDWPVRYVEQPAWARQAAPYLYFLPYRSPPPLDPPRAVDYFAPPGADQTTIKLNHVVHHGSLGHHVQNWHAARAASRIGRIAAVDCAARIAMLCGGSMAEGWACYATDLADEAGFLTPTEQYSQHHTRLRVAARAVVDVRLHHGRFSLDEATAFYANQVGMAAGAARAEAIKNSLFPGTACMYLAGWEAIRNLRRELASRQPTAFSLRDFHDRLLSFGSIPVSLAARAMLESRPAVAHR